VDNLLGNAVRHTEPGGRVTLLGERRGDGVVISVEDTGHGVDPALGQTIFDPFVTGRPDGTGLGLAIARELVQAHGGQLRLDQAGGNGLGARFVIELPAGD
jgi:signal transduction histidine kinase